MDCTYFFPPAVVRFVEDKVRAHGPVFSGTMFGAGWCFWVDAVLIAGMHNRRIPLVEYMPGFVATLAMTLMVLVRRSDLSSFDSFDSATFCRTRLWLFIAYVVSFASVVGAVALLLKHAHSGKDAPASFDLWTGWASILQVTCLLGSGLILFASRGDGDADDGFYTAF